LEAIYPSVLLCNSDKFGDQEFKQELFDYFRNKTGQNLTNISDVRLYLTESEIRDEIEVFKNSLPPSSIIVHTCIYRKSPNKHRNTI
jgi:hypothetical protein